MSLEARAKEWERMYREGKTLQQIADQYGVSRQRVHQVLRPLEIAPEPRPVKVRMPSPKRANRIWSVYVMAAPATSETYFKVGITSNIVARIKAVQTGCPLPILTVWAITAFNNGAAQDLETKLQALLWPYRTHGEWFAMDTGNLEHKRAINEAFAFAVKVCSQMMPVKWRKLSVPDLRAAVAAATAERRSMEVHTPRDKWKRHSGLDNWPT